MDGNLSDSYLERYFEELSKIPCLTDEQQIDVAKRMDEAYCSIVSTLSNFPEAVRFIFSELKSHKQGIGSDQAVKAVEPDLNLDKLRVTPVANPDNGDLPSPSSHSARSRFYNVDTSKREALGLGLENRIRHVETLYQRCVANLIGDNHQSESEAIYRQRLHTELTRSKLTSKALMSVLAYSIRAMQDVLDQISTNGELDPNGQAINDCRFKSNGLPTAPGISGAVEANRAKYSKYPNATIIWLNAIESVTGKGICPDEVRVLINQLKDAKKDWLSARSKLLCSNLRLVVFFAGQYRLNQLEKSDLIQEGNIGLLAAVEKFDYRRGVRFSTYAAYWIRLYISRAIASQDRTIRLPFRFNAKLNIVMSATHQLSQILGHHPSPEEVARRAGISEKSIRQLMEAPKHMISIDTPLRDDEELPSLLECLEQNTFPSALKLINDQDLVKILETSLQRLNPREAKILDLRFGIDGEDEKTLREIGQSMNLTRERVRQIQVGALEKLRKSCQQSLNACLE